MSADTPSKRNVGRAYANTRRMSSPTARHGERARSTVPRCSLVATLALRMPPRAPASSRNGGTSTSNAGYTRKESMRFWIVIPAITSTAPASAPAHDQRRKAGGDAHTRHDGREPVDADQIGGEEQARQGDDVAGRGHDRGGDVVEVEVEPDADDGHDHHDEQHDDRGQDPTDDGDHQEVDDGDGIGDAEADRDGLGKHCEHERDRQRQCERGGDVLSDERVEAAGHAERSGVDRGAEAASESAEDVPPHADRGGNEHEEAGERLEGAGDGAERQPGNEVATRREQERDEPRSDPGRVGANDGDETPKEARTSDHVLLGGSLIGIRLVGMWPVHPNWSEHRGRSGTLAAVTILDLLTVAVLTLVGVRLFEAARSSVEARARMLAIVRGLRWRHFVRAVPVVV